MEPALDAGAEDVIPDGEGGFEVRTDPGAIMSVHKALEKLGVRCAQAQHIPKTTVTVSGEMAEKVLKLVENLEDNDDVQHVYANFDIPDEELAALESRA